MLAGQDFAKSEQGLSVAQQQVFTFAKKMQNFAYLIGDASTRECIAIDVAYDPEGVVAIAKKLGCNISAALGTHFHYDHIGHLGKVPGGPGMMLPGMRHFVHDLSLPGFIHQVELATAANQIGVSSTALTPLNDGDVLHVGAVDLHMIHTPGHSPGSITLVASINGSERLALTGDTIFPGSCGRLDLPGSSIDAMYKSLSTLRKLDDNLPLFPGHAYNGESTTVQREKSTGLLRPMTKTQWARMMSR